MKLFLLQDRNGSVFFYEIVPEKKVTPVDCLQGIRLPIHY